MKKDTVPAKDGRNYRTAYPGRLLRPQRLERLRQLGIPFCASCGAELGDRPAGVSRCLHCGASLPGGREQKEKRQAGDRPAPPAAS